MVSVSLVVLALTAFFNKLINDRPQLSIDAIDEQLMVTDRGFFDFI